MIFVATWLTSTPSPGEIIKQAERRWGLLRTQARERQRGKKGRGLLSGSGLPVQGLV